MYSSNIQMGNFISQLKTILKTMVVKRSKVAETYEFSLDAKKEADRYINIIQYGDLWDSYVTFDNDVLIEAGLDSAFLSDYISDKNNIPRQLRDKVVKLQKEKIISSYEEKNDYYRMLNGKPPLADTPVDYIFCPPNELGIPTNIPVHQLSNEYLGYMQSTGIMDQLIDKNPTKGYLNYLGDKSITIYNARTANNYDILYIDSIRVDNNILTDFRLFYDKARVYFMIGIYNNQYSNMFVWYDEFIGLNILVMAIQRTISNIYKQGLTRDFYDVELIKYLFKSYAIPYIEKMDIKYQKALAKNLNYMLQYKSTDKVLYDVGSLLGFYDINIYKYYLIKNHRLDNNNHPIFRYEDKVQPDGSIVRVPVYNQMFTFHFQKVNLKEKDINTALTDTRNRMDYYTIITEDPYWVEDDELKQKLYETDFNTTITKYMSLDVIFKLVEMMYEVSITLRMFIDNQKDFKLITIQVPKISSYEISLYDLTIFLSALGAKKFGLKGKIPLKGYQIASVYGFNFKADLPKIRDEIYNNEEEFSKIDPSLVKYILNMRATELNDVDRLYTNITELRKLITQALFLTKDKERYYQYLKLFNALIKTEDSQELYKDHDGDVQSTFEDLLKEINPGLYETYIEIQERDESVDDYIDAIYIKLSTLSDTYKYLSSINRNEVIFEFIMKLIRFFKSYTVDFVNSGVHYHLDDRHLMGLKVIEDWHFGDVSLELDDQMYKEGRYYKDYIERVNVGYTIKEDYKFDDIPVIMNRLEHMEKLNIKDRIDIINTYNIKEEITTADDISLESKVYTKDEMKMIRDELYLATILMTFEFKNIIKTKDKLFPTDASMDIKDKSNIVDTIHVSKELDVRHGMKMRDKVFISYDS